MKLGEVVVLQHHEVLSNSDEKQESFMHSTFNVRARGSR